MKGYLAPHRVTPSLLSPPPDEGSDSRNSNTSFLPCKDQPSNPQHIDEFCFFDLVVIGAGPAGLALVARILESRPAALYTDQEHLYLHWLQRNRSPALIKTRKRGGGNDRVIIKSLGDRQNNGPGCDGRMRILVIDKLGEGWMTNWNRQFASFDIKHLRSPLFFHPAPADLDALIAFAEREGRNSSGPPSLLYHISSSRDRSSRLHMGAPPELVEILGCVGAEISKHKRASRRSKQSSDYARLVQNSGPAVNERDRHDYFTPGTSLFRDFIEHDVVKRYGLNPHGAWEGAKSVLSGARGCIEERGPVMLKGEVQSLNWSPIHVKGLDHAMGFCVQTSDGARIGAKAIVCAVGMGGCPSVPAPLLASGAISATHNSGWAHSSCLADPSYSFPPRDCNKGTLFVIGGGLTSAQICDLAIHRGFAKVILVLRGHLKVKPFDVSLDWMGRYSNLKKMEFWQEEDPLQRLNMLRSARNGGSITPTYAKILKMHEDRGALEIRTMTSLESAHWDDTNKKWSLEVRVLEPLARKGLGTDSPSRIDTISADFVVAATGTTPSFSSLPFVRSLTSNTNIPPCPIVGGLPMLTSHLQWPGLPLFCVGGYSALQVGPGAFNLGGMREAADRVVERLGELALGRRMDEPPIEDVVPGDAEDVKNDYTYFDFNLLSVEG